MEKLFSLRQWVVNFKGDINATFDGTSVHTSDTILFTGWGLTFEYPLGDDEFDEVNHFIYVDASSIEREADELFVVDPEQTIQRLVIGYRWNFAEVNWSSRSTSNSFD